MLLGSWGKVSSGSCCFTTCGITNIRSHAYCAGYLEQKCICSTTSMAVKIPSGWPLTHYQSSTILSGVFNRCWWGSNERRVWQAVCCLDTRRLNVLTSIATNNYCSASNVLPASVLWFLCIFFLCVFYAIWIGFFKLFLSLFLLVKHSVCYPIKGTYIFNQLLYHGSLKSCFTFF